jgi:ankyrin repeat protein
LLAAGANINHQNRNGRTPLFWAASRGHTETVRTLLEAGADVNLADNDSKTPLSLATEEGHTAIVNLLKEEASSQKGLRASLYDMRATDDEICERLNRLHTLDLSSTENGDHQLLFHMAKRGALKSFDFLMERSVIPDDDMNRRDKEGHTALYHAVKEGQVEMVRHILNGYRLDLTLKNNDYETLLALQPKDHPIVTLLGQYNAPLLTTLWSRAVLFFSTSTKKKSASSHHEDRPKSP